MITPFAQVHLLRREPSPLSVRSCRLACGGAISATLGRLLCKICLHFFSAPVVRRIVYPAITASRLFSLGRASIGEVGAPHLTHWGAYPQISRVCPKLWQQLHCSGPFWAMYDSTDTPNEQSSHFRNLRPSRHRYNEVELGGRSLTGSLSRRQDRSCVNPCTRIFQRFELLRTTLSGIFLPRFYTRNPIHRASGSVKVWKLTPSFPLRNRRALIEALNPSAVDETTINFSHFSWTFGPPRQNAHKQARKARASVTSAIKMGFLLGRTPSDKQVLVTWAC